MTGFAPWNDEFVSFCNQNGIMRRMWRGGVSGYFWSRSAFGQWGNICLIIIQAGCFRAPQWGMTSSALHFTIVMLRLVWLSSRAKKKKKPKESPRHGTSSNPRWYGAFRTVKRFCCKCLFSWLLRDPDMKLRTTYPSFTDAVDSFFNQVIKRVVPLQVRFHFSTNFYLDVNIRTSKRFWW